MLEVLYTLRITFFEVDLFYGGHFEFLWFPEVATMLEPHGNTNMWKNKISRLMYVGTSKTGLCVLYVCGTKIVTFPLNNGSHTKITSILTWCHKWTRKRGHLGLKLWRSKSIEILVSQAKFLLLFIYIAISKPKRSASLIWFLAD